MTRQAAQGAPGAMLRHRRGKSLVQGDVVDAGTLRARQSEATWQKQVEQLAAEYGWICWHDHDSRRNDAGFPDLLLIRERVVFIECKTETGRLSQAQSAFLAGLRAAGQEVYVMRPSDVGHLLQVLADRLIGS